MSLGYSPDHQFLVALPAISTGLFYVYNGKTLNNQQEFTIVDNAGLTVSPYCFAFSPATDLLIIGTTEGVVYGFDIKNGIISSNYTYRYHIDSTTEYWVRSISVSTSKLIAIGAQD